MVNLYTDKKTVLALDPSTTKVGWVYFDGEVWSSGVYKPKSKNWVLRIMLIGEWLEETFAVPHLLFYEQATGGGSKKRPRNLKTDRMLGAVEFAVLEYAYENAVEDTSVTASQVKATGVHKQALMEAQIFRKDLTGNDDLEIKPDEADAFGVLLAATKKLGLTLTDFIDNREET